jgi:branched-chain amino acid transport system substrate-binding protein
MEEERVMTSRPIRRLAAAAACAVAALAVAACGGSDSGSGSSSSAAGSTSTATASGGAGIDEATTQLSKYVGGTAGAADKSKSAITFGMINDEGGVPSFPEGSAAADAAVKMLNEKLGGVDGHPVKIVTCKVASGEEQGQACAQKFLNDSSISGVLEVALPIGGQAFHQTMAGKKPVIMTTPNTIASATGKNSYGISAGVFGTSPGFVGYATQFLKAKTVSLLFPNDDSTAQLAAKQIQQGFTKAGVKVTTGGFKSAATDLLAPVTASGAARTDATVALLPTPPACIAGAKAFQQAGVTKPVLALGLCINEPVKKALGDFAKWTYVFGNVNPTDPDDPDAAAFVAGMKQYAPEGNTGGFAIHSFMGVLAMAKIAADAGADGLTPKTFADAAKAYRGPTPGLSTTLHDPGYIPDLSAMMTLGTRDYTYQGNGAFKDATGGKWVSG